MTSYYGILTPSFWTGPTGRAIRAHGGKDAQLLALYLLSNEHSNMLGLYGLRDRDIREELGLTPAATRKSFTVLGADEFAFRDEPNAFVWVREMVRFRMHLTGSPLQPSDKRVVGARRLYGTLPLNAFLGPFFDLWGPILQLRDRRDWLAPPHLVGVSPLEGASKGLRRGFEGASKPDQNQVQDQDQIRKSSGVDTPPLPFGDSPDANVDVITKLAHETFDLLGEKADPVELTETVKCRCARLSIAYNSQVVTGALASARIQRERRRRA